MIKNPYDEPYPLRPVRLFFPFLSWSETEKESPYNCRDMRFFETNKPDPAPVEFAMPVRRMRPGISF
jgi:hypothetical protein